MTIVTTLVRRVSSRRTLDRITDRIPVPVTSKRTTLFSTVGAANNLDQQMRAMSQVGVLFAIVDKLATGVAATDWRLYRRARSGKEEDRVEVTAHPALVVLNRPNPFYTRQELLEASQQHQDLTGEMWWIIARNPVARMPVELWPIRPDRMKPITHPTDYITGYEYTSPDGDKITLGLDEVIFIRRPNPIDPYRGIGPVQAVLNYIDGEHYSAMWNRNFFLNGAIPGGVIEVGKTLSDPEFDQMALRWREQHQGVANAHRVAILEQAKWVDVKYSHEDMQFQELSILSDEKVRQAFGFPKPLLGAVDDVNRANAEAAAFVFAEWCLKPRLERIKAALNAEFLPLFPGSDDLEFDYQSPTPDDAAAANSARDSKVRAVVELVKAGFDPDPVLEWAEMPTLPYTKPAPPPPPRAPSPPPGPDEDGGAGSVPGQRRPPGSQSAEPVPPDGEGASTGAQAEAVYRLGMFLLEAPNGRELERRVEMLRLLAAASAAAEDRALPW